MASVTSAAAPVRPASALRDGPDSINPSARPRGVEYAALWRLVEAESARVVVIDLERRAIVAGRMMSEAGGKYAHVLPESPLERLFPAADVHVKAWAAELGSDPAVMVMHSLSPRHWTYFWRVDPKTAVLAAVRHRYGRGAVAAGDSATIRLLCEHWLSPELQAMGIGRASQRRWNRVDRRARASAPRELWCALAALCLATACGLWLAAGGGTTPIPVVHAAPPAELQRLVRLSDLTLQRSLARALADRDRLEAQRALDAHFALGHFASAVLLDDRQQVVAHVGLALSPPPAASPGAAAALPPGLQPIRLTWADVPVGQLLTAPLKVVTPPAPPPVSAAAAVAPEQARRAAGIVLALAGLISGTWLWRHLRARYR